MSAMKILILFSILISYSVQAKLYHSRMYGDVEVEEVQIKEPQEVLKMTKEEYNQYDKKLSQYSTLIGNVGTDEDKNNLKQQMQAKEVFKTRMKFREIQSQKRWEATATPKEKEQAEKEKQRREEYAKKPLIEKKEEQICSVHTTLLQRLNMKKEVDSGVVYGNGTKQEYEELVENISEFKSSEAKLVTEYEKEFHKKINLDSCPKPRPIPVVGN